MPLPGERGGRRAQPASPTRAVAVGAGVIVVVMAVAFVGSAVTGHKGSSGGTASTTTAVDLMTRQRAEQWDQQAAAVMKPVAARITDLTRHVAEWQQGKRSAADVAGELTSARADLVSAERAVAGLPPSPGGAAVADLYRRSIVLDEVWIDATAAASRAAPGAPADQLVKAGERIRELGDRVFDRGRAPLEALLPPPPTQAVEVVKPSEVPDWAAEGLAAGPPLDDPPPAPSTTPSVRQATRPSQPEASWRAAVSSARAPGASAVRAALDEAAGAGMGGAGQATSAASLRDLARSLERAARTVWAQPDPAGDRELSARVALRLLVDAEAARLGQAALVAATEADRPALLAAAHRLLSAGDGLWPADLPPRPSGEPAG